MGNGRQGLVVCVSFYEDVFYAIVVTSKMGLFRNHSDLVEKEDTIFIAVVLSR